MTLRPLTFDDVDTLVALDRDPEVMRYISGGRPTPREQVVETVRRSMGCRWMASKRAPSELSTSEPTTAFVGWFGLVPSSEAQYEVGYRLHRDAWGKGLATEGTRTLIDVAFAELGATRVWAQTMAVNLRSRAVMERCGLRYVRTFHLEWDDPIEGGEVEYELSRAGWERRASTGSDPA